MKSRGIQRHKCNVHLIKIIICVDNSPSQQAEEAHEKFVCVENALRIPHLQGHRNNSFNIIPLGEARTIYSSHNRPTAHKSVGKLKVCIMMPKQYSCKCSTPAGSQHKPSNQTQHRTQPPKTYEQ